jgi:predicted Zn-dependent protease
MPFKCLENPSVRAAKFILCAAFPFLFLIAGCTTVPVLPESESMLSRADERMLWQRADEAVAGETARGNYDADSPSAGYVNRVTARLRPVGCPAQLAFSVYIAHDPFLNAYAYPNGAIVITTGLLAYLDDEAQLAAILAHEMAHSIGRDALRACRQCGGPGSGGWQAVHGARTGGAAADAGDAAETADCLQALVKRREMAADARCLDMLVASKYDPAAALDVLSRRIDDAVIGGPADRPDAESIALWKERLKALDQRLTGIHPDLVGRKRERAFYRQQILPVLLSNAGLNLRCGRYGQARQDLKRYLEMRPEDARAHHLLGESYRRQGGKSLIGPALTCYREAIRIDGGYAAAHKALGMLHYKQGHRRLAVHHFETALSLSPNDPEKAYMAEYLAECRKKGDPR